MVDEIRHYGCVKRRLFIQLASAAATGKTVAPAVTSNAPLTRIMGEYELSERMRLWLRGIAQITNLPYADVLKDFNGIDYSPNKIT
jgi:hypothetical protein